MHVYVDSGLTREISASPRADVKARKVPRAESPMVLSDTATREKSVMARLMLAALSGTISAFAAICRTVIYSTVLGWRYFWLAVCVAGLVALVVFLWKVCERF
jgi:hypothetical protein